MADNNFLDQNGVLYLWQKIKTKISDMIANKVDKVDGKGLSTNDYTTAEKTKLAGIAEGANKYTHPTTSGNKHIPAGGSSGQILRWGSDGTAVWGADNNTTYSDMKGATTSAAGTHGLAPAPAAGAANRYLRSDGTWSVPPDNNTTYGDATQSAHGLMTAADKKKLDGIATGANNYTHPTTSGNKHIPSGGSAGQILRWSADGTATWGSDNNTTYSDFKTSTADAAGVHGLVPAPPIGVPGNRMLFDDGTWSKFITRPAVDEKNGVLYLGITTESGTALGSFGIPTAEGSVMGLMTKNQSDKLSALPTNATLQSTYAKKSDITGVYKYKGSVATEDKLPTSGQTTGDVYDIVAASSYGAAGMNVAWNGKAWDALGEKFQISAITNTWMDTNLT